MKKLLIVLTLCSLVLAGCGNTDETGKVVETIVNDISMYDRAASLLDEAYDANRGNNVIVSPLSLNTGLSLLSEGANSNTKDELISYLCKDTYNFDAGEYMRIINSVDGINMANSIWVNKNIELVESFKSTAKASYLADINSVSFETAYLDNTVKDMNNWAKEKTNGLIPNIVKRDDLTKDTSAVIINSLYFKSAWTEELYVSESKFKDINAREILTDMLSGEVKYYYENEHAKAFSKEYENGIKFIGILPNEEKEFTVASLDLQSLFDYKTDAYKVMVSMPKISVDFTMSNVANALKKEGVNSVFDPSTSNLSGIVKESAYVSNIVQRCKVELDEKGTEAAAVTTITMVGNSIPTEDNKKTKKIDLNRPFVFMIYDEENEQILFMGKIVTIE